MLHLVTIEIDADRDAASCGGGKRGDDVTIGEDESGMSMDFLAVANASRSAAAV